MHPTQLEILDGLRQASSPKKFSELLRDVAETSDNLAYHLKQLQKSDYIVSPEKGMYALAGKGIAYLNNNLELQHDLFPTVSCMLELHGPANTVLIMKKLKQPYLGKLHLLTFGVTSAKPFREQIQDFLDRYKIRAGNTTFKTLYRERIRRDRDLIVFDKFFVVFHGTFSAYEHGVEDRHFIAMPVTELIASPTVLSATKAVLKLGNENGFSEATITESPEF